MTVLFVRHRTEYQYRQPVTLSEHRLMSRPRDSHDLRLLDTTLLVSPAPSDVRWMHDVFGNSIAVAHFQVQRRHRGMHTRNDVWPSPVFTSTSPPCACTIWDTMYNPSPSPSPRPDFRSPPRNGSNR